MNLLDAAYAIAAVIAAPWWMRKARSNWPQRFGHTATLPAPAPARPRILLHAVSVGEVSAIRALVPLLAQRGAQVVVSVGTDTGIARARELFEQPGADGAGVPPAAAQPVATVVRYPLDFSRCVRRFLDAIRPDAVGLIELEVWPNFVRECSRRDIPVAVINGRLSERSFRGYRRIRPFIRRSFARLARAGVQDDAYRERFIAMGVPEGRCTVTGSMKWDAAAIADSLPGADDLAREIGIDRSKPLIVGGSTGPIPASGKRYPGIAARYDRAIRDAMKRGMTGKLADLWGEESLLHEACPEGAQLLCAPRKPERFGDAVIMLGAERCARRTDRKPAPTGCSRFLLDTIGELRTAYSLADVVVVGRSLGRLYGSDPIEPIALGKATVIGPAVKDFESIVSEFDKAAGIVRTTAADLPRVLRELLADPARRRDLADRGRACIRSHQGATLRHADLLMSLVQAKTGSGHE